MKAFAFALLLAGLSGPADPSAEAPPPASPLTDPDAIAHFAEAQKHFDTEDYEAAIPELKAAYAAEPNPLLLYAWAQAERFNGACTKATELYRRYIETKPTLKWQRLAETNILDCEAQLAKDRPPPPQPEPTQPEDKGPKEPLDLKPAYKDWLGATLVGVGAGAAVAGGVLIGLGQRQLNTSIDAVSEQAYFDALEQGRTKRTAGYAVLGVGGALILAGIVRYAILAGKNNKKREQHNATAVVLPRGFGLGLRF